MTTEALTPPIDWNRLRELRDLFLSGEPVTQDYWASQRLLRDYDITLGERIGWKWDAVLQELQVRGWTPPSSRLYDYGCGTGVAARRLLKAFPGAFKAVTLWDRSERAMKYAKQKIRHEHPFVKVDLARELPQPHGVVSISQMLTECGDEDAAALAESLEGAKAVIWVEPGTYAMSRMLIEVREALKDTFSVRAPCTHQAGCGLLADGMEAHWCHHFAPAETGAHQNPFWGHFRREMNLDIGPVAYSFLALDKRPAEEAPGASHLIGRPVRQPKFIRLLSCQEEGVSELVASRKCPLYRELKQEETPALYRFERKKNRIQAGERVAGGG
jgi:SAM-dependent methyltransferase